MSILREYIEQVVMRELSKPEAPEDAPFGQYAFAPRRPKKDVPQPPEPNTSIEDKVQLAIIQYITGNDKGPLSANADLLVDLVRKGYYKNVLSPEKYKTAYRLMELDPGAFASIVGMSEQELQERVKMEKYVELGPGTLSPKDGLVAGWTVDSSYLEDFSALGDGGNLLVIFSATISNNMFIGTPGKLPKAVGQGSYGREMETISVGPVKYDRCVFTIGNPPNQEDVLEILTKLGAR